MATNFEARDLIDLDKYPLDNLDSPEGEALVTRCRLEMSGTNSCVLRGFIKQSLRPVLADEAATLASKAFFYEKFGLNCYRTADDARYPLEHPRRRFYDVKEGVVAYDQFPLDSLLRKLYNWQPLAEFLARVFEKPALYPFEDQFQGLNLMVIKENEEEVGMGWHFDENEFTITIMMQPPESGGEFEYVPDIRSAWDENYRAVADVLEGQRERVLQEPPEFGMLALFRGGFSLHRVAPVKGETPRIQCIATFEKQPGMKASAESSMNIYGPRVRAILERQSGK